MNSNKEKSHGVIVKATTTSGKFTSSSSSKLLRLSKTIVRRSILTLNRKKTKSKYHVSCCRNKESIGIGRIAKYTKRMDTDQALPTIHQQVMKLATPKVTVTSTNGTKTPAAATTTSGLNKPSVHVNRSLFGYRTPNPTSTTSRPTNAKLAQTMDAKSTAAVTHKSRLPVSASTRVNQPTAASVARSTSGATRPATTPSVVKQRLEFFNKATPRTVVHPPAKTPMTTTRLGVDVVKTATPLSRLFTPKTTTNTLTLSVAKSSVKRTNSNANAKPTTTAATVTRNPTLLSKTPAAKRAVPSAYEKKVSRTVDCAKSIKRRSIKFLNAKNEQRISRSRVSILNEMDSRCLIVTPDIMRQIITSKEILDGTPSEPSSSQTEATTAATIASTEAPKTEEEIIKVHTVKSSSLLKFLLCESAKKAAAAVSRLASPFTQASPKSQTPAPATTTPATPANISRDLILWDETKNASNLELEQTPARKVDLSVVNSPRVEAQAETQPEITEVTNAEQTEPQQVEFQAEVQPEAAEPEVVDKPEEQQTSQQESEQQVECVMPAEEVQAETPTETMTETAENDKTMEEVVVEKSIVNTPRNTSTVKRTATPSSVVRTCSMTLRSGISQTPQANPKIDRSKLFKSAPRMKYRFSINCGENRPSLAEFLDLEKKANESSINAAATSIHQSVNDTVDEEEEQVQENVAETEEEKEEMPAVADKSTANVVVDFIPETQAPSSTNQVDENETLLEEEDNLETVNEVVEEEHVEETPAVAQIEEEEPKETTETLAIVVEEEKIEEEEIQPQQPPQQVAVVVEQPEYDVIETVEKDETSNEEQIVDEQKTSEVEAAVVVEESEMEEEIKETQEAETTQNVVANISIAKINLTIHQEEEQQVVETPVVTPQETTDDVPASEQIETEKPTEEEQQQQVVEEEKPQEVVEEKAKEEEQQEEAEIENEEEELSAKTRRQTKRGANKLESETETACEKPVENEVVEQPAKRATRRGVLKTQENTETCDEDVTTTTTEAIKTRKRGVKVTFQIEQTETEEEQPPVQPKRQARRGRKQIETPTVEEQPEEVVEKVMTKASKSKKRGAAVEEESTTTKTTVAKRQRGRKAVEQETEATTCDDEEPVEAPTKSRGGRRGAASKKQETEQTEVVEEPAPKRRGRKQPAVVAEQDHDAADDESHEPVKTKGGRRAKKEVSSSSGEETVAVASIDVQTEPICEEEVDENVNPQAPVAPKKGRAKKSAATLKEEQAKRALRKSMVLTRAQRAQLSTKN